MEIILIGRKSEIWQFYFVIEKFEFNDSSMMINNIDRNKYFIEWTHLCNLYNTSIYPMMNDNKYQ